MLRTVFNGGLSPSDPVNVPVMILGQHQHLAMVDWDVIKVKLEPRVTRETWTAGVASLSPTPTDVGLYMNLATVGALPVKVSRHNTQSRAHSVTKLVKSLTSGSSEVSSRETSGGETDTVSPVPAYQPPGEDDFNADIVCHHGNLRIEERSRQIISREAWAKLSAYFYKPTITFQFGVKPCYVCEEEQNQASIQREKWREEAARQKSRLPELFKDTDRPRWSKPSTTRVFLLSSSFVLAFGFLFFLR